MGEVVPIRTKMSAVDIASLDSMERVAILVHLVGHQNPVVAEAVVEATRKVLSRTRGEEE